MAEPRPALKQTPGNRAASFVTAGPRVGDLLPLCTRRHNAHEMAGTGPAMTKEAEEGFA